MRYFIVISNEKVIHTTAIIIKNTNLHTHTINNNKSVNLIFHYLKECLNFFSHECGQKLNFPL